MALNHQLGSPLGLAVDFASLPPPSSARLASSRLGHDDVDGGTKWQGFSRAFTDFRELFVCRLCERLLDDPYTLAECGHSFCGYAKTVHVHVCVCVHLCMCARLISLHIP